MRTTGDVEPDHPGDDQHHRENLDRGHGVAEEDHAVGHRSGRADPGPHRVRGADFQALERRGEQAEGAECEQREADRRPQFGEAVAEFQADGEAGFQQPCAHDE